jgi:hypothetical protein
LPARARIDSATINAIEFAPKGDDRFMGKGLGSDVDAHIDYIADVKQRWEAR